MTKAIEPSKIYLLSYQAIGKEVFFNADENYLTFLKTYAQYLLPLMDTYAYCLLPNQIQWLVKIKDEKEIFNYLKANFKIPEESLRFEEYKNLSDSTSALAGNLFGLQINKQISALFKAYFEELNQNEKYKLKAFHPNMERKEIVGDEEFKQALISVHLSSEIKDTVEKFDTWKFSSYAAYLSEKPSSINRKIALDLFEGKENFVLAHHQNKNIKVTALAESSLG